jgi:hypothetical protein
LCSDQTLGAAGNEASKRVNQKTAVRVEVFPGSEDRNNTFASGNYVSINGKCHVLRSEWRNDTKAPEGRQVRNIEMIDGFQLTLGNSVFLSHRADLVLLEVRCENGRRAAEIASVEPHLGQPVVGISRRPKGTVDVHCRILKINLNSRQWQRFETDCSATHGLLGTGPVDPFGPLTAVAPVREPLEHLSDESLNEMCVGDGPSATGGMESSTSQKNKML